MNIGNYGSAAYQSQMERYREAIERERKSREERENGSKFLEHNYSFYDVLVLNENGEVTGRRNSVTGETEDITEAQSRTAEGFARDHSDMSTINVLDLFDKSRAECIKQLWAQNSTIIPEGSTAGEYLSGKARYEPIIDMSNVQVADFSGAKPIWEIYTKFGDKAHDASIVAGYFYQKSCVDFTYVHDFRSMTESEDFTGMTPEEIYKAIYAKYQHCYGEHFLDITAVDFINPPDSYNDNPYRDIVAKFNMEVMNACGLESKYDCYELRRNALYPDMTDEEVEQAIIDEYVSRLGSDITNADICKMTEEMHHCGVGHGARNMFNHQWNFRIYGEGTSLTSVEAQDKWLKSKASSKMFDQVYGAYKDKFRYTAPFDPEVGGVILRIKDAVCPPLTFYR